MDKRILFLFICLVIFAVSCRVEEEKPAPENSIQQEWTEEQVLFKFGAETLAGMVTLPDGNGPHPAVVLVSGSNSLDTGVRAGISSHYFSEHARTMAREGYAVLRYDPPGVGSSTGEKGIDSLDVRVEEAMAALTYMQTRPDIQSDKVGMWGGSQGSWVIAMSAAAYPEDVAFIISVSGSGISVAEQQVFSIEAQSRAAGFDELDISKAALIGRLLIDWQLIDPIYQEINETEVKHLGPGHWNEFMALVYEPGEITPAESLEKGIDILRLINEQPWSKFIYLEELLLPQLESLPPEYAEQAKEIMSANLMNDPKDYLSDIRVPVLALFGAGDVLQPSERSAQRFEEYLKEAGNENFEIVIISGVGHSIHLSIPEYRNTLTEWLSELNTE